MWVSRRNNEARGESRQPAHHIAYFELRDALEAPGCPVCRLAEESVEASHRALLHESVNDPEVRERLAVSGGFCRQHAWLLPRHRDRLGVAILHRDLVTRFRDELKSNRPRRGLCPACVEREQTVRATIEVLMHSFEHGEIRRRFEASDGLCREHFQQARAAWNGPPDALEAAQGTCLSGLLGHLDELIRKQDYRFSHEPTGEEKNSWLRGIAAVSGLDVEALPRPRSSRIPPAKRGG